MSQQELQECKKIEDYVCNIFSFNRFYNITISTLFYKKTPTRNNLSDNISCQQDAKNVIPTSNFQRGLYLPSRAR